MEPNLKAVRAIVLDVDGVMRMAAMNGYILAVVTGGHTEAVHKRMVAYGVPYDNVYMKARDKRKVLIGLCERFGLSPEELLYMGDDIPDAPAMEFAGVAVAPADAAAEALEAADIVSPIPGGRGFVRWTLELVMKAQGKWIFDVNKYEQMF